MLRAEKEQTIHRLPDIIIGVLIASVSALFGQTEWTKYLYNPVLEKDTTVLGAWEWAGIGQPTCLFDNDTFKMWYAAAGVAYIGDTILRGRISYAYSVGGTTWVKSDPPVPVLDVGPPGAWDSRWCDTPAILHDGIQYILYYYGDSLSVAYSAIGVATSPDGLIWTRHEDNPILERGELLDWDGFWIESPAVLHDSATGTYSMWYTGVGYGPGKPGDTWIQIGYAYSYEGLVWHKDTLHNPVLTTGAPGSWDDGWVAVPAVRKQDGLYEMWYCAASIADWMADSSLDTGRVGYATSPDGINWTKHTGNPVLSTFDPPPDSGGPWAPDILFDGSGYDMWYETAQGIFLATAPMSAVEYRARSLQHIDTRVFPNPFRDKLMIVTGQAPVTRISIYDAAGRCVRTLTHSTPQSTMCTWDGRDDTGRFMPEGVYFVGINSRTGMTRTKALHLR